jgi:hypothetical protein
MSDARIEFLVKARDGLRMAADAIDDYLQTLGPKETSVGYDPEKIKWQDTQGDKGPYQKSTDSNSLDHKELLKDLAAHKGKLTRRGFFYWVFQDGSTIGRKRKA